MKRWSSILVLFVFGMVYPLHALVATVNGWNSLLTSSPGSGKALLSMIPGMVVTLEDASKGPFQKVSYKNFKGYLPKANLRSYTAFSPIKGKALLSPRIVQEGQKQYIYSYKSAKFYKYNITDRKLDSFQKLENLLSITPSPRDGFFIVEGITTNGPAVHQYALYHFPSGKMTYLGSFDSDFLNVEDFEFSENAEYLAVVFGTEEGFLTCLYRTSDGELLGYAAKARKANWIGDTLLLSNKEYLWMVKAPESFPNLDMGYQKERLITRVPSHWIYSGSIDARVLDNLYYINTYNGVVTLDIKTKTIQQTPFRGLTLSQDKTLNFYIRKNTGNLWNVPKERHYTEFMGNEPKIQFIAFAGNHIIGRSKYERIDTLFLFDEKGKELYRYRAIDDPMAIGTNGVIAEIDVDKDLYIITVEDPNRQEFYFIFDKEQD